MIYKFKLKGTNLNRDAYAVDVFLQTDESDPKSIRNFTDVVFHKDRGFLDADIFDVVDSATLKLMNNDCLEHIKKFEQYVTSEKLLRLNA